MSPGDRETGLSGRAGQGRRPSPGDALSCFIQQGWRGVWRNGEPVEDLRHAWLARQAGEDDVR